MRLVHNVFFTLVDRSEIAVERLIAECKKHLSSQAGIVFFAAGGLAKDLQREVNDREWDVGLHLIFASAKHQADYQDDPQHLLFIAGNKANWARVRVFDSVVD